MIKAIARLIVALNANTRPGEIGAGAAFGLMLALVPGGNLLWTALFIVTFFLKLNTAVQLLLMALFRLVVPIADPALDALGHAVLTLPGLAPLFTALLNAPVLPLTRFNDTVVMGGLLAGLLLWVPAFFAFVALVRLYRRSLRERIANSRLVRAILRFPFLSAIGKAVQALGGASGSAG